MGSQGFHVAGPKNYTQKSNNTETRAHRKTNTKTSTVTRAHKHTHTTTKTNTNSQKNNARNPNTPENTSLWKTFGSNTRRLMFARGPVCANATMSGITRQDDVWAFHMVPATDAGSNCCASFVWISSKQGAYSSPNHVFAVHCTRPLTAAFQHRMVSVSGCLSDSYPSICPSVRKLVCSSARPLTWLPVCSLVYLLACLLPGPALFSMPAPRACYLACLLLPCPGCCLPAWYCLSICLPPRLYSSLAVCWPP